MDTVDLMPLLGDIVPKGRKLDEWWRTLRHEERFKMDDFTADLYRDEFPDGYCPESWQWGQEGEPHLAIERRSDGTYHIGGYSYSSQSSGLLYEDEGKETVFDNWGTAFEMLVEEIREVLLTNGLIDEDYLEEIPEQA